MVMWKSSIFHLSESHRFIPKKRKDNPPISQTSHPIPTSHKPPTSNPKAKTTLVQRKQQNNKEKKNSHPGCTAKLLTPLPSNPSFKLTEKSIFPVLLCPYATNGLYGTFAFTKLSGNPFGGCSSSGNSVWLFWKL